MNGVGQGAEQGVASPAQLGASSRHQRPPVPQAGSLAEGAGAPIQRGHALKAGVCRRGEEVAGALQQRQGLQIRVASRVVGSPGP